MLQVLLIQNLSGKIRFSNLITLIPIISSQNAFSYNKDTKLYDSINAQQTNNFKNHFIAHRMGFNFKYSQKEKVYFQAGGSVQAFSLNNKSTREIYTVMGNDTVIHTKQSYLNFFPTANFRYSFKKHSNLHLRYRGRTNQPNVSQLQDVRDETFIANHSW